MENWIHSPIIYTELFCDAPDFEWGGVFETKPTGGAWSESEKEYHINEKEFRDRNKRFSNARQNIRYNQILTGHFKNPSDIIK